MNKKSKNFFNVILIIAAIGSLGEAVLDWIFGEIPINANPVFHTAMLLAIGGLLINRPANPHITDQVKEQSEN